jgi:hypothetical protein
MESGQVTSAFSDTESRVITFPVGTLCDVVRVAGPVADVDLYLRDGDTAVAHRISGVPMDVCLLSIKGKPFVPGDDERRNDLNGGSGTTAPVTRVTPAPKVTAVPRSPEPPATKPDAASALGALAEAMGVKLGGGLDEAAVRVIVQEELAPIGDDVVQAVQEELAPLADRVTDTERKLGDVLDALATASPAVRARVRVALSPAVTGNAIVDEMARWYTVGEDLATNLLLASPPSLGKSYAVREFGRGYDLYLEHGCSDEQDEQAIMLGSPLPDGKGGFIVSDGVITQGVRAASEGKTVLVLLDEILRLSSRTQEWLLSFLTGRKRPDGTRYFELRTRRVLPDGNLEVLTCEASHFHIVGATNLGMLAPIDAFWSRFEKKRFAFDPATIRSVCNAVLASFGMTGKDADKLAAAWTVVVTESRKEVANGTLRFPADIRMLERCVAVAGPTGTPATVGKFLATRLVDNMANWTADLGETDAESVKVCERWFPALNAI